MAALATARMLAAVVVGQLRTSLREEGGAAYSVSGNAQVLNSGGAHLVVSAAIDSRRLREALGAIRGHWAHFARGEFDAGSLSQARWDLVEAENLAYQTSTETALRVLDAASRGWSPSKLLALPDAYRAVRPADLARAFATCNASTVTSLLGDEPTIRAALK
jgi:predicted Zn-dependent peptidase